MKMNCWKRMLCAMLAVLMLTSLLPELTISSALAVGKYARLTTNDTKVRTVPGGEVWRDEKLDKGFVVTVQEKIKVDGVLWYSVKYDFVMEDGTKKKGITGFIKGDCLVDLTVEEATAWEANPVQTVGGSSAANNTTTNNTTTNNTTTNNTATKAPAASNSATAAPGSGYVGTVTSSGVNFRETEAGKSLFKLNKGDQVTVLTVPSVIDSEHWFYCKYDKYYGYIQAPYLSVKTTSGAAVNVDKAPAKAMATPTVVPSSTGTYVKLILSSANLRDKPDGSKKDEWTATGSTLPVTGKAVKKGDYTWYPVQYKKNDYYVRGDCVQLVDANGAAITATPKPTASATPKPEVTATPAPGTIYVTLTMSSVNLRDAADGRKVGEWTKTGETKKVTGKPVDKGGYTWYPITMDKTVVYVRGDCVTVVGDEGETTTPAPNNYGYVKTTKGGTNIRTAPAGAYLAQADTGVVMPRLSAGTTAAGGYVWYYVNLNGTKGYVRNDCVEECNASGKPTGTTAQPAEPADTDMGKLQLTADKVNLRKTPGGDSIAQLAKSTGLTQIGTVVSSGKYNWYPVRTADGKTGYIRSDFIKQSADNTATKAPAAEATATPAPTINPYGYIKITMSATNFRSTPGGTKIAALDKGGVYAVTGAAKTSGGYKWYPIRVNGKDGYVRNDCLVECDASGNVSQNNAAAVTVMFVKTTVDKVHLRTSASKDSASAYNIEKAGTVMAYTGTKTVGGSKWYNVVYENTALWVLGSCVTTITQGEYDDYIAANPSKTVETEVVAGYIVTTASGVNVRKTANGTNIIGRLDKGKQLSYASTTTVGKYTWYYCKTSFGYGYVRGDCVKLVDANGKPIENGTATGNGNTDAGNLTMAIYPAEKIDWYTGGIQTMWPKGTNVKVYDVKTGIVWWAHRWSGGYHADIETLTQADSDRLAKIYGVKNTAEIASKNLWQRRPCLVTIGSRTFACSLYGVPHNYPDGDTIANNGMKGQVCLHFTNSKTHAGNKVDSYHTEAIEYAWLNAPNGHK